MRNESSVTATKQQAEGLYLLDKPAGVTSFSLVRDLRKKLQVKKVGHAGTLDPFATGLMILLVGREFTKRSDEFLLCDKEYLAEAHLGVSTDSFDCDGQEMAASDKVPTIEEIHEVLPEFQGEILQTPTMFSAKKVGGKKLYDLARKGQTVERKPCQVKVKIDLLDYTYPKLTFRVTCSKGTYIRSLAHDIGEALGCGAHLTALRRTRIGSYSITDAKPLA